MRIGIAQTSPAFGERDRNIEDALQLLETARQGADQPRGVEAVALWVLPELFASGYQFASVDEVAAAAEPVPGGPTTEALADYCAEHGSHVVAGLPERDGDRLFNSAVLVGPEGFVACYRKVHLFYQEKLHFSAGDRPFFVVDIGEAKVGMMICFDHLFPESARSLALEGADIIAHPANLVLPDLAQQTMKVRALENGVYTATSNRIGTEARTDESLTYTGRSQIVGPDTTILARLSADRVEATVVDIDIAKARDKTLTPHNDKLGDRRPDLYRL